MITAVLYLGMAVFGFLTALPLRAHRGFQNRVQWLLRSAVLILVFLMGFRLMSGEQIVRSLDRIGGVSVFLAAFNLAVNVAVMTLFRRWFGYDRYGKKSSDSARQRCEIDAVQKEQIKHIETRKDLPDKKPGSAGWRGLHIAGVFAAGALLGYTVVFRMQWIAYEQVNEITGNIIMIVLYMMVFFVGADLGMDGGVRNLRGGYHASLSLAIPVLTGISTVLVTVLCGFFLHYSVKEGLLVACTFCWYSFAPNVIMDAGFAEIAATAFLSNFLRVIFSLLFIPFVAKKIGFLETVGMAQAASMDVCIGTIKSTANDTATAEAFFSGMIFTLVVPIVIPLILKM